MILWMGSAGPGAEHAQGGQQPTVGQQLGCPPATTQQPLSGRWAQAMEQGDGGGLRRKRRKESDESKVPFFCTNFWAGSLHAVLCERPCSCWEEGLLS